MNKYIIGIALITFLFYSKIPAHSQQNCDDPEATELSRIYFSNGMFNNDENIRDSFDGLTQLVGSSPIYDYGIAYNDSENFISQLLEVYNQRKEDTTLFWYWQEHLQEAEPWFQESFRNIVSQETESLARNDPDLNNHISQYLRDLRSGKKVAIVSHSQGNFYANSAFNYISSHYPEYMYSIGIVAVATPSSYVAGGSLYSSNPQNYLYTTNKSDVVINAVRQIYPTTLAPNPTIPFDDGSLLKHSFVDTYLKGFGSRIRSHIMQNISRLTPPQKSLECQNPSEVPVIVATTGATNISKTSAQLNGRVESGKDISVMCVWNLETSVPSCEGFFDQMLPTGPYNAGDDFYCTPSNLSPGTAFRYRVCGRQGERLSSGAINTFSTNPPTQQCNSTFSTSGGSEGLSVDYNMGYKGGIVHLTFQTYSIPDKLEIWQRGTKIYTTGGYVSGLWTADICHHAANGEIWDVRVYGNSNTGTAWDLTLSCPETVNIWDLCY